LLRAVPFSEDTVHTAPPMPIPQDTLSAGTQVVALTEVRGTNRSLVHPRGAVGVVTRTPAGTETLYLVRFPDGFESTFTRDQLEVLKHFKDRLGRSAGILPASDGAPVSDPARRDRAGSEIGAPQGGPADPAFDLERFIIYRCVVGSRAYGLDTDASDTDLRGIYLAPAELQWSLFGAPEQFEDNAAQTCYWELQKFLIMALKANPNILECLWSPLVEKATPLGEELLAMRACFLSQMIFQTFNGYALSQFKKIEQDRRNHGEVRWKHAMHLLRLLLTGAATLRNGSVPVRVEAHRDRLLAVKRGEIGWPEVDAWRQQLHRDFEHALAETTLPERPDYEAANLFLVRARRSAAG
jgi:predicted nucleotidyltransferase